MSLTVISGVSSADDRRRVSSVAGDRKRICQALGGKALRDGTATCAFAVESLNLCCSQSAWTRNDERVEVQTKLNREILVNRNYRFRYRQLSDILVWAKI